VFYSRIFTVKFTGPYWLSARLRCSDRQLSQSSDQTSPDDVPSRRGSTPSDSGVFPAHLFASNPDLASLTSSCDDASGTLVSRRREVPDHVVKIYRADQTFRYLVVHRVGSYSCLCSTMELSEQTLTVEPLLTQCSMTFLTLCSTVELLPLLANSDNISSLIHWQILILSYDSMIICHAKPYYVDWWIKMNITKCH